MTLKEYRKESESFFWLGPTIHPVSVPSQGEEDPDKLKCITYSYIANQEIIKEYAKII